MSDFSCLFFQCNWGFRIETNYCNQSFATIVTELYSCFHEMSFILNAVSIYDLCFCWGAIPDFKLLLYWGTSSHSIQIYYSCPGSLWFVFFTLPICSCLWLPSISFSLCYVSRQQPCSFAELRSFASFPFINKLAEAFVSQVLISRIVKEHQYFIVWIANTHEYNKLVSYSHLCSSSI